MPAREHLVVFEPSELPACLQRALPPGAAPGRCMFWVARQGSVAVRELMAALPEEPITHVEEGMQLATTVSRVLSRGRLLADLVRPEEVAEGRVKGWTYAIGFHTAAPDEVRETLRSLGHTLHPVDRVLASLLVLHATEADGAPSASLSGCVFNDGVPRRVDLEKLEPGLFVSEGAHNGGEGTVCSPDGRARVTLPRAGAVSVQLERARPALSPDRLRDAERAVELINDVFAGTRDADGQRWSLTLAPVKRDGRSEATLISRAEDVILDLRQQDIAVLAGCTRFDETRYRRLLEGARLALSHASDPHPLPQDLVPGMLWDEPSMESAGDVARVVFDLPVLQRLLARRPADAFWHQHQLSGVPDLEAVFRALPELHERLPGVDHLPAELAADYVAAIPPDVLAALVCEWTERSLSNPWLLDCGGNAVFHVAEPTLGRERVADAMRRGYRRWQGAASNGVR
ncbi:MAG: hypothetical protein AB8I08_31100 [Sandaracinaceae bacterium]